MLDLLLRKEEKDWLRQLNRMRHLLFTELCQRVPTLFDLPVPGIGFFWNRKNETSTSLSPTVLSTNSANPRREYWLRFSRTWARNCCLYSAYFLCRLRQPRGVPISSCFVCVPLTPLMGRNLLSSHFYFVYTRKEGFVFSKTENWISKKKVVCTLYRKANMTDRVRHIAYSWLI